MMRDAYGQAIGAGQLLHVTVMPVPPPPSPKT
jgi:hypothetical protein